MILAKTFAASDVKKLTQMVTKSPNMATFVV